MLRNRDYKYDKIDYLYQFLPCILVFQWCHLRIVFSIAVWDHCAFLTENFVETANETFTEVPAEIWFAGPI